jgi:hypothetical protein
MNNKSPLTIPGLLGDFRLLVILFISFRFMLLIAYQPLLIEGTQRGITTGGDYYTYYQLTSLGVPYQEYWSEFPPAWTFLSYSLNQLSGQGGYASYAMLLGLLMIVVDVGNLILLWAIGVFLYGGNTGISLAWIYALLIAPMVFAFWTFEPLVAFFILLPLWLFAYLRGTRAALVIGVGALIKFTPALILGAVWRFRRVKHALRHTIVATTIFVLAYIPLFSQNATMTMPSLTAQFSKASYETVWALIDGNYRTGNFGPLEDRFYPERASILQGNPSRVPSWLRLGVAAVIGLFIFLRTKRFDHKGFVAFTTITLMIFFLQAQGWSPQWIVQLIPLILLCFPTRSGVLIVVMLSLITFAEYPFLFIRTGDAGGEVTGSLVMPFVILILARTGILVGLCVGLYRILRQEPIVQS